jgi:hypothetical protein
MSDSVTPVEILLGGTFDIAETRRRLRDLSDKFNWTSLVRLRLIAAFTALAETLFFDEPQPRTPLVITLHIVRQEPRDCVEYHVDVVNDVIRRRFPVAHWRLKRASDELDISSHGDHDHIIMRLWSEAQR